MPGAGRSGRRCCGAPAAGGRSRPGQGATAAFASAVASAAPVHACPHHGHRRQSAGTPAPFQPRGVFAPQNCGQGRRGGEGGGVALRAEAGRPECVRGSRASGRGSPARGKARMRTAGKPPIKCLSGGGIRGPLRPAPDVHTLGVKSRVAHSRQDERPRPRPKGGASRRRGRSSFLMCGRLISTIAGSCRLPAPCRLRGSSGRHQKPPIRESMALVNISCSASPVFSTCNFSMRVRESAGRRR